MKPDETPMFDPNLLKEVDWSQNTATFSPAISPAYPGEGLVLRPLCTADLNRGFLKVLGQLTETGVVNPEQFMKSFEHMKKSGDYYVTVVEDVALGRIVATATLIVEHKFIHSCAKAYKPYILPMSSYQLQLSLNVACNRASSLNTVIFSERKSGRRGRQ
ncbi:glucosamine 6-phosphate N-acetyltransferase isoform X2 [Echinops telfairi]|uniref:Glucosamine 6-phosphate N-acetyltransferase isoform X2 n=1 Tax=Echinops telfairi TaxID=9371 RepID=A0AC55CW23_ECHTE|nr:glucosamine 6-phosphate N-acetyltransferase isoform X2 [Echinops telfairi]